MDRSKLRGKYLSVFGASMCSFEGISNDAGTNTTIGENESYYVPDMASVHSHYPDLPHSDALRLEETFWMQAARALDLKLLVNNSWSGSKVTVESFGASPAYLDRCRQLHADTGEHIGQEPDVILSFMGCNDYMSRRTVLGEADEALFAELDAHLWDADWRGESFAQCYGMMAARMADRYPDAVILLFNMPCNEKNPAEKAERWHALISKIAARYGCLVVDLTHSPMRGEDYDRYSLDGLHPNAEGMKLWTELVLDALEDQPTESGGL